MTPVPPPLSISAFSAGHPRTTVDLTGHNSRLWLTRPDGERKRKQYTGLQVSQPPRKKKNSTRVSVESWQHRQHCVFPATYRDGGKEAVRLDNKAATLVFILSWIITPESNGLIFCVRKKTCCLFGSSVILR